MSQAQHRHRLCEDFADQLIDLSDGELPANERAAVEAHLATCVSCREQRQRLDTSLAALRHGIVPAALVVVDRNRRFARTTAWIAIGSTAAAILLAVGISSLLKAPTSGRGELAKTAILKAPTIGRGSPPNTLTTGQGFAGQVSTEDALRQIALLEQQARLETSLALMPNDPWFAEQRAANEHLLTTFREAAAAGVSNHSPQPIPRSKETL